MQCISYGPCYQITDFTKFFQSKKATKNLRVQLSSNYIFFYVIDNSLICVTVYRLRTRKYPDVLLSLAGRELTTVINVIKDKHNRGVFLFHATDIYEASLRSTSVTDISSPPEFPVINITDVSLNEFLNCRV